MELDKIKTMLHASITEFAQDFLSNGRLQRNGIAREWIVGDVMNTPPKDNNSGSFHLALDGDKAGSWFDFATGEGGGLLDIIMHQRGVGISEAINIASEWVGVRPDQIVKSAPKALTDGASFQRSRAGSVIQPVPKDAPDYPRDIKYVKAGKNHGSPDLFYEYRDESGQLHYVICRFNNINGKKEVLPLAYVEDGKGNKRWWWKGPNNSIPYRLDKFDHATADTVVIVEGEKCADALASIMKDDTIFVTTWRGGAASVGKTNWDYLMSAKVVIWPDNDDAGKKCAKILASTLESVAASVSVITPPEGKPDGWDAADAIAEGMAPQDIIAMINSFVVSEEPEPEYQADEMVNTDSWPFICLGEDEGGTFYYMNIESDVLIPVRRGQHNYERLCQIAPVEFWAKHFPKKGNNQDFDPRTVVNALMRIQNKITGKRGFYDVENVRRSGCYYDNGKFVVNTGKSMIYERNEMTYMQFSRRVESTKTYGKSKEVVSNPFSAPSLSTASSTLILDAAKLLSWRSNASAHLAAGWISIAPLINILEWRPHIWVTGPRGTGKTQICKRLFRSCLGNWNIHFQGSSSEAGIRSKLNNQALPFIFDEAEDSGPDKRDAQAALMRLIRTTSSDDSPPITKGTATGGSISYNVKTAFALFSINPYNMESADYSRFAILEILVSEDSQKWEQFCSMTEQFRENDFSNSFIRRQIEMAPKIMKAARMFHPICSKMFKSDRAGDQYGTLLAGSYMLYNDEVPTENQVREYVYNIDWMEQKEAAATDDGNELIMRILTSNIIDDSKIVRTVADLWTNASLPTSSAARLLEAYGIKRKDNCIIFLPSHEFIKSKGGYSDIARTLRRHPNNVMGVNFSARFGGMPMKAVMIDISTLAGLPNLKLVGGETKPQGSEEDEEAIQF